MSVNCSTTGLNPAQIISVQQLWIVSLRSESLFLLEAWKGSVPVKYLFGSPEQTLLVRTISTLKNKIEFLQKQIWEESELIQQSLTQSWRTWFHFMVKSV